MTMSNKVQLVSTDLFHVHR